MTTPQNKKTRPPPIKLPLSGLKAGNSLAVQSPLEDVLTPGCYIEPYILSDRQRAIVTEILQLRIKIQSENPCDRDDKAQVLESANIYLSNAIVAECYYYTSQDTVLVSCLTQHEGRSHESRPDSIFAYNVKDSENVNILRKLDTITTWIDKQIQSGKTVFLHCYAGINRSASIALAYHCLKTGHDIVTGFKYLAEQRPGILSNMKFIEQLVIWADAHGLMPT